jgi:esterase/lipase superfamily enzyme
MMTRAKVAMVLSLLAAATGCGAPEPQPLPEPVANVSQAEAYLLLGEAELQGDDPARAQLYFQRVLEFDSADPLARAGSAAAYMGQRDLFAAQTELDTLHRDHVGLTAGREGITEWQATGAPGFYRAMKTSLAAAKGTVSVLYGTDRARTGAAEPNLFFGADRRRQLELGRAMVSIPYRHKRGRLERPLLEIRPEVVGWDIVLTGVEPLTEAKFYEAVRAANAPTRRSVFVFVHGYNVAFSEAMHRTAQLAVDIGLDVATPVAYSWPSQGSPFQYISDRDAAMASVPHFIQFLAKLAADGGVEELNVVAHSMGNLLVSHSLVRLASLQSGIKLRHIVMAAPDVAAEEFETDLAPRFRGLSQRMTLYASSRDGVLQLSRFANKARRAGDSDELTIVDGVDTIDASEVSTGLGHAVFGDVRTVVEDLAMLLREGLPPDRRNLEPRTRAGLTYWAFPR